MLLAVVLIVLIPFGGSANAASNVGADPTVDAEVIESFAGLGGTGESYDFTNFIKVNDTVYFSVDSAKGLTNTISGLIAYNIKTGKETKLTDKAFENIKYYKGYIYGCDVKTVKSSYKYTLYRVNVKTGKVTKLISGLSGANEYTIYNNKLYVGVKTKNTSVTGNAVLYSLSLNGKSKKKLISKYAAGGSGDGYYGVKFYVRKNYIIYYLTDKNYNTIYYSYNMTTKKTIKLLDADISSDYLSSDRVYYCYKNTKTNKYVYAVKSYAGKIIKTYKSKKKYEAALKLAKKEDNFESYDTYRTSDSDTTTYIPSWATWKSGYNEYASDYSTVYCINTITKKEKAIYKANAKKYKGKKVTSNTATVVGVTGNYLVVEDCKETATKYIIDYKLITSSGKVVTTLYTRTDKNSQ
jgi:hypothetical protein